MAVKTTITVLPFKAQFWCLHSPPCSVTQWVFCVCVWQIKWLSRTGRSGRWSRRSQRWWPSVLACPTWPPALRYHSISPSYSTLNATCWLREHWCISVWRSEGTLTFLGAVCLSPDAPAGWRSLWQRLGSEWKQSHPLMVLVLLLDIEK